MSTSISKILSTVIKIAGLIITAPVTFMLAGQVFADVQPDGLRIVVQISALTVVEGVFMAAWWSLDADRAAPQEVKTRNALTALSMYGGLWVLALVHGEGLAGLVFRLALGLALVGSIFDSGVHTSLRAQAAVDRNAMSDRKVKKHARNLARQVAIAQLDAGADIDLQRIALDRQNGLTTVKREARANIERFPYPIDAARDKHERKAATRKAELMPKITQYLSAGMSKTDTARAVGVSRQTVTSWVQDIGNNGNEHKQ